MIRLREEKISIQEDIVEREQYCKRSRIRLRDENNAMKEDTVVREKYCNRRGYG